MQHIKSRIGIPQNDLDKSKEDVVNILPFIICLFYYLQTIARREICSWLERHPKAACLIYVLYILCSFVCKYYLSRNRNAAKKDDEENVIGLANLYGC